MSLISVILPVYNGEKTIRETIESVLDQSYSDLELIIINDGSEDTTLSIIDQISDSRLKVFSYPNAGLAASRNRGIKMTKGEYISFIDADDLWTVDKLELQLQALQQHPEAAVAYSLTNWIDESGVFLRPGGHIIANGNVYQQLLLRDFIESGSNVLVCHKVFTKVGYFNQSLKAVEDWDMWLRLAAIYDFVCVPLAQILYRISSNSMSSDIYKMEKSSLEVINKNFINNLELDNNFKKKVVSSRYQYFTIKALDGEPTRKKTLTAIRFLLTAITNDPTWAKKYQLMLILIVKIAISIVLPSQWVKIIKHQVQQLKNNWDYYE